MSDPLLQKDPTSIPQDLQPVKESIVNLKADNSGGLVPPSSSHKPKHSSRKERVVKHINRINKSKQLMTLK